MIFFIILYRVSYCERILFIIFYHFNLCTVKLLTCDLEIMSSNSRNSLLQKVR